ncbi:MAG: hypothetical protein QF561_00470 [Phycisphaerales bacterium]|jgi:hypothetical protein|nr:hypothetical protein [Phycisphaerales bacterium]
MRFLSTTHIPIESGELLWAIAALAVGLILWVTGGWLLRSAVGALGLGLGALGGLLVWMQTGIGPPWAAPLVGALVVACVALLAYRLLAGTLLALTLALLGGCTSWTIMHLTQPAVPPPPVAHIFGLEDRTPVEPPAVVPVSLPAATTLDAASWMQDDRLIPFKESWSLLPADARLAVLAAAGGAALGGLIVFTLMGSLAAVLLTSVTGAGLVLAATPRILSHWNITPDWLHEHQGGTLIVLAWLSASGVGIVIQMLIKPKGSAAQPGRS